MLAALASGVVTYRVVGPYGDGPFSGGFHRIPNPETGQSSMVYDFVYGSQPFRAACIAPLTVGSDICDK